jgi:hypothetical protein
VNYVAFGVNTGNLGRSGPGGRPTSVELCRHWNGIFQKEAIPLTIRPAYRGTGNFFLTAPEQWGVGPTTEALLDATKRAFALFSEAEFLSLVLALEKGLGREPGAVVRPPDDTGRGDGHEPGWGRPAHSRGQQLRRLEPVRLAARPRPVEGGPSPAGWEDLGLLRGCQGRWLGHHRRDDEAAAWRSVDRPRTLHTPGSCLTNGSETRPACSATTRSAILEWLTPDRESRLHRAESRVSAARHAEDLHSRLISYWIAFNAFYGQARDSAKPW